MAKARAAVAPAVKPESERGDQEKAPSESVALAKVQAEKALADLSEDPFGSVAAFSHWHKVAAIFAESGFVPQHFRGRVGDCLIALQMARQMEVHPLTVMQNMFLVSGRPGWTTAFLIACTNRSRVFRGPIRWRVEKVGQPIPVSKGGWSMPNLKVTAFAVNAAGEEISASVDTAMAIADGWTRNEKYRTMAEHMLKWRSAAFLIRLYCPEVTMGLHTVEELETLPPPEQPARASLAQEVGDVVQQPGESKVDAFVRQKQAEEASGAVGEQIAEEIEQELAGAAATSAPEDEGPPPAAGAPEEGPEMELLSEAAIARIRRIAGQIQVPEAQFTAFLADHFGTGDLNGVPAQEDETIMLWLQDFAKLQARQGRGRGRKR